jgi:hypothetical protein
MIYYSIKVDLHASNTNTMALPSSSITHLITLNLGFKTKNVKVGTSISLGSTPSMCVTTLAANAVLMLLHHNPLLKKSRSPTHGSSTIVFDILEGPRLHFGVVHLLFSLSTVVVLLPL